jgi:hypothetical protein
MPGRLLALVATVGGLGFVIAGGVALGYLGQVRCGWQNR